MSGNIHAIVVSKGSRLDINFWFIISGSFLLLLVLGDRWLKHGPISPAIVYLAIGFVFGPKVFGLFDLDVFTHTKMMELGAEIVVIISLFSAGLKLRMPFTHPHWKLSALLASLGMVLTVTLLSVVGHFIFDLPWGAAVLLGGILAPTDPVLASEVQVKDEKDSNRIRRALTGEAGFNDGMAFPVIMLGLTLLSTRWEYSDHPLLKWALVDVAWAVPGGLAIGYLCGWLAVGMISSIHSNKSEDSLIEDFASIGLTAIAYGLAQVCSTYGFLAVFAAAVAFARHESRFFAKQKDKNGKDAEGLSPALVRFSTQMERYGEALTVLFVGLVVGNMWFAAHYLLVPVILILLIRPIAVFTSLRNLIPHREKWIVSWFGIRGIGSVYYLAYALNHGAEGEPAQVLTSLIIITIVCSIFVHGISAGPLMRRFGRTS